MFLFSLFFSLFYCFSLLHIKKRVSSSRVLLYMSSGFFEDRQPDIDAEFAMKTIQVTLAIYEATSTGKTVDVTSI